MVYEVANQARALRRAGQWRRERYGELAKAADEVAKLAGEVLKCGDAQCVLGYEGAAAPAYWAALSSAFGVPGRSPEASGPFKRLTTATAS